MSVPWGGNDRIPRLFLGMGDLVVLGLAFVAANAYAPLVQRLLLPGGMLSGVLPSVFPTPTLARPELFPSPPEVIWLLAVACYTSEAMGDWSVNLPTASP